MTFSSSQIRSWLLSLALIVWVAGYWWCRGRWEHDLWLRWFVLPAFALNADVVWTLWKDWWREAHSLRPSGLWWAGLFSILEWQFWMTGLRTGDWWGGAGSGRDLVLLTVLISSLVLVARDARALAYLWRVVAFVAFLAVFVSLVFFYSQYSISEERFRLVWRYQPGFNAVTTGLLVGFALVVAVTGLGEVPGREGDASAKEEWRGRGRKLLPVGVLFVFGGALAATESRGALLAVLAAWGVFFFQRWRLRKLGMIQEASSRVWGKVVPVVAGGLGYWLLAARLGESSSELVSRGSAGRLEIYQQYLTLLRGWDWILGQGVVTSLPAEVLGWVVHHPHNAYLGQLTGYGFVGCLLLVLVMVSLLWRIRARAECPLLVFGLTACLFDGGQMWSVLTLARWETLLIVVPAIVAVARLDHSQSLTSPQRAE